MPAPASSDSTHSVSHLRRRPHPLPPVSPSSSHHPRPARLRPACRLGLRLLPRLLPKCAVQFALWRGLPHRQCCPRLLDLPGLSAAAKGTPAQSSANGASHAPSDLPTVSSPLLSSLLSSSSLRGVSQNSSSSPSAVVLAPTGPRPSSELRSPETAHCPPPPAPRTTTPGTRSRLSGSRGARLQVSRAADALLVPRRAEERRRPNGPRLN